jgi:hypothetical protein
MWRGQREREIPDYPPAVLGKAADTLVKKLGMDNQ